MPESSPSPRGHRDPEDSSGSCSDSSSGSDADGEDESSSITQEKLNTSERSSEFLFLGLRGGKVVWESLYRRRARRVRGMGSRVAKTLSKWHEV